jgi:hypothetical protein
MSRMLIIKSCEQCPLRTEEESHGPCDSDYWMECSLTGEVVANSDNKAKWNKESKFPPFCPLKEAKVK